MLPSTNLMAVFVRFCVFLQLIGATAMIFAMLRAQILLMLTGKQSLDSVVITVLLNIMILFLPVTIALTYPHVGSIAGISGAIGTMFTVIIIPSFTYTKKCYDEIGSGDKTNDKSLPLGHLSKHDEFTRVG